MDKNIGKKLDGRYEITELIGVGGMADVYKATDVVDHKTVAVKILKRNLQRTRNSSAGSGTNPKPLQCCPIRISSRSTMWDSLTRSSTL